MSLNTITRVMMFHNYSLETIRTISEMTFIHRMDGRYVFLFADNMYTFLLQWSIKNCPSFKVNLYSIPLNFKTVNNNDGQLAPTTVSLHEYLVLTLSLVFYFGICLMIMINIDNHLNSPQKVHCFAKKIILLIN